VIENSKGKATEQMEDEEDYQIALARLKDNLPTIPLEDVVKQLDLEDGLFNR